jgi:hypothetical protein
VDAPMKAPIVTNASRGMSRAVALQADVPSAGIVKMLPLGASNRQATFTAKRVLEQAARLLSDRRSDCDASRRHRAGSPIRAVEGSMDRLRANGGYA